MTGCGSPGRYARRSGPFMRSMRTLDVYSTSAMNSSLLPGRLGSLYGGSTPNSLQPLARCTVPQLKHLNSTASRLLVQLVHKVILTASPKLDDDAEKPLCESCDEVLFH